MNMMIDIVNMFRRSCYLVLSLRHRLREQGPLSLWLLGFREYEGIEDII
jgi:hypothetical protein